MSFRGREPVSGPSSVPSGTRLNGIYEIDRLIAQGGMAEVYEGHSVGIGDRVAIKVVLAEFAADQLMIDLFRKEARILHLLNHDAIVRYHMFATDERLGLSYLAMEFVDGQSLAQRMKAGPLGLEDAITLKTRLADGLQLAHDAGIIHRDLSPENIILPGNSVSRAKIIDFGIAKSATVDSGRTLIGSTFAGRYTYASPEQLGMFAPAKVSPRSDIYSLGLVLAAVLRGEPIDMSGTQVEVIEKRRRIPDLDGIAPEMHDLLRSMLEPNPADRPASMAEVRDWHVLAAPPSPQPFALRRFATDPAPPDQASAANRTPVIKRPPTKRPSNPPRTDFPRDADASGNRMGMWIAIGTLVTIAIGAVGGWIYATSLTPAVQVARETATPAPTGPKQDKPGTPPVVVTEVPDQPAAGQTAAVEPERPAKPPLAPEPPPPPGPDVIRESADAANFIRAFNGGDCFFVWPIEFGEKQAVVAGYGTNVAAFDKFESDFRKAAGYEPSINARLVSVAQCSVVDALRRISRTRGKGINPGLKMPERQRIAKGETISGSISAPKDLKLELLAVDDAGMTRRYTGNISNGTFSVPGTAAQPGAEGRSPNLLIVLATQSEVEILSNLKPDVPVAAADVFPELIALAESGGKITLNFGYFVVTDP